MLVDGICPGDARQLVAGFALRTESGLQMIWVGCVAKIIHVTPAAGNRCIGKFIPLLPDMAGVAVQSGVHSQEWKLCLAMFL